MKDREVACVAAKSVKLRERINAYLVGSGVKVEVG